MQWALLDLGMARNEELFVGTFVKVSSEILRLAGWEFGEWVVDIVGWGPWGWGHLRKRVFVRV